MQKLSEAKLSDAGDLWENASIRTQDYKSLLVVVMFCAHCLTHRQILTS